MKPYIIAEIGVNWDGNITKAIRMIESSKKVGADAVKFQMFNEDVIKGYPEELKEKLSTMILTENEVSMLSKEAIKNNIDFIVSTMYPEAFEILRKIEKIDYIKIRHADRHNDKIADEAIRFCIIRNIGLLISCSDSFDYSWECIKQNFVHPLYCVPEYPTDYRNIHIRKISNIHFEGYSNHIADKYVPMIAIAKGFKFIEVHVKDYRNFDDECSLDEPVSLSFDSLNDICDMRDAVNSLSREFT